MKNIFGIKDCSTCELNGSNKCKNKKHIEHAIKVLKELGEYGFVNCDKYIENKVKKDEKG